MALGNLFGYSLPLTLLYWSGLFGCNYELALILALSFLKYIQYIIMNLSTVNVNNTYCKTQVLHSVVTVQIHLQEDHLKPTQN